jgi:hypothetical protein
MLLPTVASAGGSLFKALDLYDNAYSLGARASECELCAMTKEITVSFWRLPQVLVEPQYPTLSLSDSVATIIRGTCRTFAPIGGFDRVYIKTLAVGSDSTGVKTAWSMNWR